MSMKEHEILLCPVAWILVSEDAKSNPLSYELYATGESGICYHGVLKYEGRPITVYRKRKGVWMSRVTALTSDSAEQTKKDVESQLGIVSIPADEYDKLTEKGN